MREIQYEVHDGPLISFSLPAVLHALSPFSDNTFHAVLSHLCNPPRPRAEGV